MSHRGRPLLFGAVFLVGAVMHWVPPDWNPFVVFPGMLLEIIGVVGFLVTLIRASMRRS